MQQRPRPSRRLRNNEHLSHRYFCYLSLAKASRKLWRFLHRQYGHVSIERLLTGSGLYNIYHWLTATKRFRTTTWRLQRLGRSDPAQHPGVVGRNVRVDPGWRGTGPGPALPERAAAAAPAGPRRLAAAVTTADSFRADPDDARLLTGGGRSRVRPPGC